MNDNPSMPLHDRLTWLTLVACVVLFVVKPDLDLLVAQRFYTPGVGFTWANDPVVRWMYDWTPWIGRGLIVALAIVALWGRIKPAAISIATRRMAAVALCVALIGPGVIVEVGLKPYWQRPRPVQVQNFGGDQIYRAPFRYCAPCTSHHSFVSSHAANGYFLLALGLVAPPPVRRRWFAASLIAGTVIGMGRMAQGGHFLSDVLFAFFAVWLSGQLVTAFVRRQQRTKPES